MLSWKALLYFIIFSGMVISCNGPTAPTFTNLAPDKFDNQAAEISSLSSNQILSFENNCGNPNDWIPDDFVLQTCLDRGGNINLDSGSPGYIINGFNGDVTRGLWLSRSGTTLISRGSRAKIIAGRDLYAHILQTAPGTDVNNFVIENISFDGMVDEMMPDGPYRKRRDDCNGSSNPGNLFLQGYGFHFRNNDSQHALCGSGLGLYGNFNVQNNYIAYNGRDKFSGGGGFPWADGMTVLYCEGGYIAHNTLVDNTDIELVVGGGRGCIVELNTIEHLGKYAFAGLNIGNFNRSGDHVGSEFRGNTISSRVTNRLSIGILVGSHPWTSKIDVINAGKVVSNTSRGNVINLVVDGVYGGEIIGNTLDNPQGNEGLGTCRDSLNYAVYLPHVFKTVLQAGYLNYQYDGDLACGFYNMISKFNLIRPK